MTDEEFEAHTAKIRAHQEIREAGSRPANGSASFTQNAMLVLLPIAVLMAFALPHKAAAVFQAAICAFSLGVKVALRWGRD
jgi:hypothetical protein